MRHPHHVRTLQDEHQRTEQDTIRWPKGWPGPPAPPMSDCKSILKAACRAVYRATPSNIRTGDLSQLPTWATTSTRTAPALSALMVRSFPMRTLWPSTSTASPSGSKTSSQSKPTLWRSSPAMATAAASSAGHGERSPPSGCSSPATRRRLTSSTTPTRTLSTPCLKNSTGKEASRGATDIHRPRQLATARSRDLL